MNYPGVGCKPNAKWGYEEWNPNMFEGNQTLSAATKSKNLGSKLHLWIEKDDETEDQVAGNIMNPLRVIAQQTWGSPKLVTAYNDFSALIATLGRAPGWVHPFQLVDLAAGKPTTASTVESGTGFVADRATDSDPGTYWSSDRADPQWIRVDLGAVTDINRVKLTWHSEAYATAYRIETSNDSITWTPIHTTTNNTTAINDLTGLTGKGRYLRVYGTARSSIYGYALWSLEAYNK